MEELTMIDDYFEYRAQSATDQEYVWAQLTVLTEKLRLLDLAKIMHERNRNR